MVRLSCAPCALAVVDTPTTDSAARTGRPKGVVPPHRNSHHTAASMALRAPTILWANDTTSGRHSERLHFLTS